MNKKYYYQDGIISDDPLACSGTLYPEMEEIDIYTAIFRALEMHRNSLLYLHFITGNEENVKPLINARENRGIYWPDTPIIEFEESSVRLLNILKDCGFDYEVSCQDIIDSGKLDVIRKHPKTGVKILTLLKDLLYKTGTAMVTFKHGSRYV